MEDIKASQVTDLAKIEAFDAIKQAWSIRKEYTNRQEVVALISVIIEKYDEKTKNSL